LITDFGYNGRHAYFFDALDKGYYGDAGLEVKIVRSQGSMDAIRQVGAGNAMFGFAAAARGIGARQRPAPGQACRRGLSQTAAGDIFCREDSGLKKPKDLERNATTAAPGARFRPYFRRSPKLPASMLRR
jgi:NitT/TauT family transport system substrate-binding protein